MNKIKRETIRALMKIALNYPSIVPHSAASSIFRMWNRCQRDFAADAYARNDPHPQPEAPLKLLDLSCTSGFGENVHPDVLFVPNGFGPGKWKYLMTCTPLPQGVEYFENPEFLVSDDGIHWQIPEGGASPLVPPPDDWIGYNSDPSLYMENETLYMFYRDNKAFGGYVRLRILLTSTTDGLTWSKPQEIMSWKRPRKDAAILMSPSVIKFNGAYYMWYVWRDRYGLHHIYRMESSDLFSWSNHRLVRINGLPDGEEPWHPDVAVDSDGKLMMALCCFPRDEYRQKRILLCKSNDGGILWDFNGKFINRGYLGFGEKSLYRPSLVLNSSPPMLYYSGQDNKDHWHMSAASLENYHEYI